MSEEAVHPGRTTKVRRGVSNTPISLCPWFLAAVLFGMPALAQEAADDDGEDADVAQTEVEEAEVTPQTELEDAPVVPQREIEEIVVTGSRIARTPGELAGNLVVLGEEFIEATGEATLERVMRQLPQNLNSTSEQIFSDLNGVDNFTGASTVNLRGLGSESTLILIDGKRIGYNGFLGGVTDISKIPCQWWSASRSSWTARPPSTAPTRWAVSSTSSRARITKASNSISTITGRLAKLRRVTGLHRRCVRPRRYPHSPEL